MSKAEIRLGSLVRDRISGFEGIAVAVTHWVNGCSRWTLQPRKLTKEGAVRPNETFDVEQLEVVGRGLRIVADPSGGPHQNIQRATDPK